VPKPRTVAANVTGGNVPGPAVVLASGGRRVQPFAFAAIAGLAAVVLPPGNPEPAELVAAIALTIAIAAAAATIPVTQPPRCSGWRSTAPARS